MSSIGTPPRRRSTPPPRPASRFGAEVLSKPAPTNLREICRSPYYVLRYDITRRLVIATRLSAPFESLSALQSTFDKIEEGLDGLPRGVMSLLVDSRRSPARNDPEFEALFAQLRQRLIRRAKLTAVYMQTAIGVLHSTRHSQMDGTSMLASVDLRDIEAYLGVSVDPSELELDGKV